MRFAAHSTNARETRSADELTAIRAHCPIRSQVARLRGCGMIDAQAERDFEDQARNRVSEAFAFADASPYPDPAEALTDVG
jgi:pyruvate dehydrogenase E1 component alpha subunit